MKSGANIGSSLIVIGILWPLIGSALWLSCHLGAPYGSPGTRDIPEAISDYLLADRDFVALAVLVTSVLPGLAVAGIGFLMRKRGRAPEGER